MKDTLFDEHARQNYLSKQIILLFVEVFISFPEPIGVTSVVSVCAFIEELSW